MGKKLSIGVSAVSHKGKKMSIGVSNAAHKVKKAWIGDASGKARLFWSSGYPSGAPLILFGNNHYSSSKGINYSATVSSPTSTSWTVNTLSTQFTNTNISRVSNGFEYLCFALGRYWAYATYTGSRESFILNLYYSTDGKTWTLYLTSSRGGASSTTVDIGANNEGYVWDPFFMMDDCMCFLEYDGKHASSSGSSGTEYIYLHKVDENLNHTKTLIRTTTATTSSSSYSSSAACEYDAMMCYDEKTAKYYFISRAYSTWGGMGGSGMTDSAWLQCADSLTGARTTVNYSAEDNNGKIYYSNSASCEWYGIHKCDDGNLLLMGSKCIIVFNPSTQTFVSKITHSAGRYRESGDDSCLPYINTKDTCTVYSYSNGSLTANTNATMPTYSNDHCYRDGKLYYVLQEVLGSDGSAITVTIGYTSDNGTTWTKNTISKADSNSKVTSTSYDHESAITMGKHIV